MRAPREEMKSKPEYQFFSNPGASPRGKSIPGILSPYPSRGFQTLTQKQEARATQAAALSAYQQKPFHQDARAGMQPAEITPAAERGSVERHLFQSRIQLFVY
jgi:hypothetical protein